MNRKTLELTVIALASGAVVIGCSSQETTVSDQTQVNWTQTPPEAISAATPEPERNINANTYFAAGHLFEQQEMFPRAIVQYQRALGLDPKHIGALNRLGMVLARIGRHAEAEQMFQRAIAVEPSSPLLRNNLGFVYVLQQRWGDAETEFRHALRLKASFGRARINLGMALSKQGRYEEALQEFLTVLPEPDAYYNLGLMLRAKHRYRDAADAFQLALDINPKFTAAQAQLDQLASRLRLSNALEPRRNEASWPALSGADAATDSDLPELVVAVDPVPAEPPALAEGPVADAMAAEAGIEAPADESAMVADVDPQGRSEPPDLLAFEDLWESRPVYGDVSEPLAGDFAAEPVLAEAPEAEVVEPGEIAVIDAVEAGSDVAETSDIATRDAGGAEIALEPIVDEPVVDDAAAGEVVIAPEAEEAVAEEATDVAVAAPAVAVDEAPASPVDAADVLAEAPCDGEGDTLADFAVAEGILGILKPAGADPWEAGTLDAGDDGVAAIVAELPGDGVEEPGDTENDVDVAQPAQPVSEENAVLVFDLGPDDDNEIVEDIAIEEIAVDSDDDVALSGGETVETAEAPIAYDPAAGLEGERIPLAHWQALTGVFVDGPRAAAGEPYHTALEALNVTDESHMMFVDDAWRALAGADVRRLLSEAYEPVGAGESILGSVARELLQAWNGDVQNDMWMGIERSAYLMLDGADEPVADSAAPADAPDASDESRVEQSLLPPEMLPVEPCPLFEPIPCGMIASRR